MYPRLDDLHFDDVPSDMQELALTITRARRALMDRIVEEYQIGSEMSHLLPELTKTDPKRVAAILFGAEEYGRIVADWLVLFAEKREQMSRKAKFLTYCKLTCLGGSERGECSCKHPHDCELQNDPEFPAARREAATRMRTSLRH